MYSGFSWEVLGVVPFEAISRARLQTHYAVQWLAQVARSVLDPLPDDSHSSLIWDRRISGFTTADLTAPGKIFRLCMNLADLELFFMDVDDAVISKLSLDSRTNVEIEGWLSSQLADLGFSTVTIQKELPYELDPVPDGMIEPYDAGVAVDGRSELARWYSNAALLFSELVSSTKDVRPGPSPIRCWPHHYDLATLVRLEIGDPETAKSVGIGLSPGDSVYTMPYFYVNPWPAPSEEFRTDAPSPGKWHTEGFTSIILDSASLLSQGDEAQFEAARRFVMDAYKLAARVSGR